MNVWVKRIRDHTLSIVYFYTLFFHYYIFDLKVVSNECELM